MQTPNVFLKFRNINSNTQLKVIIKTVIIHFKKNKQSLNENTTQLRSQKLIINNGPDLNTSFFGSVIKSANIVGRFLYN